MQLIQDPKGWEIIGDLLSNPDLIAQFTGGSGGLEKLLGSVTTSVNSQTKTDKTSKGRRPPTVLCNIDVGPGDGDLGTDFSGMINERKPNKGKKPTAEELPEIAENVDETDYYNAIESGIDELEQIGGEIETVEKPDEIAPPLSKNIDGEKKEEELPEISESIDESEKAAIRVDGTDTLVIDKNGFSGGIATKTDRSSPAPRASPTPSYTSTATRFPSAITTSYNRTTTSYWPYGTRTRIALATTTTVPYPAQTRSTPSRYTYPTRTYSTRTHLTRTYPTRTYPTHTYSTTQRTTTATRRVWSVKSWVTPTTARATTKNFRKDSDYYAMYYDDV
uniref:PRP1_N domain-containing protein n=1 Tax=Ascaris lumbricoides TaxID=6252 RepID=A0A0M3IVS6_ASCLU